MPDSPDPTRWRILAVLLTAQFMSLVGVSIINVVLPAIQAGIDASAADLQWVLSGYALAFGVLLVPAGRAGDVHGRGAMFIAGVSIVAIASLAAGLAAEPGTLTLARFVQGAGSGLIAPQVIGMLQQYFRGPELGRAYGLLGAISGVSVAVGPLLGGVLVALLGPEIGWRWTFLANIPIGLVTILLALLWFSRPLLSRAPGASADAGAGGLDPIGSLLLGSAVLALLLPFVQGREAAWVWWLIPLSAILFGLWVLWERSYAARGRSPMVDLRLFRIRSFTFGTTISGLYYLGITSLWVLVAIYAQQGQGFSALQAGLLGLPSALCAALGSQWAGKRVAVSGRRIVAFGIGIALLGLGSSMLVIALHAAGLASLWWLLLTLALTGVAQGVVVAPNQALAMMDVPLEQSGSAGGLTQTSQRIGTAIGIAMITAVFYAALGTGSWSSAMNLGLASIAAVVAAALVVALLDQRRRSAGG